ncbi:HAD-IA family hydrolase [Aquisalimonas asiatica]|uniref:Phosphoglycolate phosphatase n=1 Tax=Aquisalimonas asiatica TaxID=406100 RepID=A0A1H8RUZ3_9GAMM|nr:HAD-IA family hydrolase [Aquisalimonas asiatica]SEO69994.1 phosphoglycolate phosphatase [Aquisalimonas asiatica]
MTLDAHSSNTQGLADPLPAGPGLQPGGNREPAPGLRPAGHLRRPAIETVLFDLDGTLLDTAPDLIAAANTLLQENDRPALAAGLYAPVVSHGSAAMIARSFDLHPRDPAMEPLRQRFLQLYRSRVSSLTRPFAGIPELLEQIEAAGLRWGVVTNKPGWLTEPLLEDLDLSHRAACVVSGDTVACRKPDPRPISYACELLDIAPHRTVVVGDALRDVSAGRLAGTSTLVALFGYICAEDEPTRWGADGLIGHPGELLRWLPDTTPLPEHGQHD